MKSFFKKNGKGFVDRQAQELRPHDY